MIALRTAGVLLAPVTITPTKPLTLSHAKGLLWLDVMYRATREVAPTGYEWNPRVANLTAQTAAFWAYLDRVAPGADWSGATEAELGEAYVRSHSDGTRPRAEELRPYLDRVEAEGWTHPASRRLIALWLEQLRLLGMHDPGLAADRGTRCTAGDVLDRLAAHGLLVDHRRYGGPAYLDGPRWGQPLRQLVGEDGHLNYLVPILRDLLPRAGQPGPPELTVLVHDPELTQDYVSLARVLEAFGGTVRRLPIGRVPIGGVVRSSRYGDWAGTTLADLSRACLRHVDVPTYRLGLRIYLVAVLNRGSARSFDPELLRRSLKRARRLIERSAAREQPAAAEDLLRRLYLSRGYVDPYRLTTSLLNHSRPVPPPDLARRIYWGQGS
jgi:hypothetical protein